MAFELILVLINIIATIVMTGVIWLVQIDVYPLFARVGSAEFKAYHAAHVHRITYVVAIPVVLELLSSIVLLYVNVSGINHTVVLLGALLMIGIVGLTIFLIVPCHHRLSRGFNANDHSKLLNFNLLRSFLWTMRFGIVLYMLIAIIGGVS